MSSRGWTVGVDLGGTFIKVALINPDGTIVARDRIPTGGAEGHEAVLARMADGSRAMIAAAPGGAVVGVGVGVPGMVDMVNGRTGELTNIPGWDGLPVCEVLGTSLGLPVRLINDARAFTLAEHLIGAAKGADTALCVTVGTGIGGGIVAHGKVLFGLGGSAGEVGHQIVQPGGIACGCGLRGCVEPLSTGPAIAGEAMRRCVQGFPTSLHELSQGNVGAITPEMVDIAAEAGDRIAIEILEEAGHWLGLGLAGSIATIAPEVVVIGGGVARPGGRYWNSVIATARSHVRVVEIDRVRFEPAALGYDAGVIGAALWGSGDPSRI